MLVIDWGPKKHIVTQHVSDFQIMSLRHDHGTYTGNKMLKSFGEPAAMWVQHKREDNLLVTSAEVSRAPD